MYVRKNDLSFIVKDKALYVGEDETQWANTDKDTIPELHKVTAADSPDPLLNDISGFHIDSKYKQIWDYTPKAKEDIIGTEEYNLKHYAELRASEYPPHTDYLDAVVKGNEEQKQAYIDACLAIKLKYPKP